MTLLYWHLLLNNFYFVIPCGYWLSYQTLFKIKGKICVDFPKKPGDISLHFAVFDFFENHFLTEELLANPQENLGVYPINRYTIPASMSVNIDHTRFCQNWSSSFPNHTSFLIYFFLRMCTILYDAKVGAVFMKGNLRYHTDAL